MFSAHNIATHIINWCLAHDIPITNFKLQKLLYFAQGEYGKLTGQRLIEDDFYAWPLGPVIPSVYTEYCIYSSATLPVQKQKVAISEEVAYLMDAILDEYAYLAAWDLVELSRQQDPWRYQHEIFGDFALIPYKCIADCFGAGRKVG